MPLSRTSVAVGFRILSRLLAAGFLGLLLLIVVGHGGFPPFASLQPREQHLMLLIWAILAGLGLMLPWPGRGGVLVCIAVGLFDLVHWNATSRWPGGWVFPALFVTGLLGCVSMLIAPRLVRR